MAVDAQLAALAARLQSRCLARGLTVGTAESCTGGLVVHALTSVAGASGYVVGGIVSYDNRVKAGVLGVPGEVLATHGAVSEATARAMAHGARRLLGATVAVSVTGIAGPSGGTPDKPVGLTFLATDGPGGTEVRRCQWTGDRASNVRASTVVALEMLLTATENLGAEAGRTEAGAGGQIEANPPQEEAAAARSRP